MNSDQQAFDRQTRAWLQYNESAKGQLRHAVILQHLTPYLARVPINVLDVGGGTGELAIDLAKRGHAVTLLDFSSAMLSEAQHRCDGLDVTLVCAPAGQIPSLFRTGSFDLIACHSLLEFVDDRSTLLAHLASILKAGGMLSVVVGNRYHQVLQAALREQNFHRAQQGLDDELPSTDLFGLPRHTFYPEALRQMIEACGLQPVAEYGVRVFSDLMADGPKFTPDLLALELAAGERLPFRHLARFIHLVAEKG